VPSRSFTSPPIECWTVRNKVLWFFKNIQTTRPVTQHYISEGRIVQQWKLFMNILTFISDCSHTSRCTAPHTEARNMTISQWTIWNFTVCCQQWKMSMNILTFISDCSHSLCLIRAAEADALCHIQKNTIWQLTNEQSDTSQFTVSQQIEEKNSHLLRPFNLT